MCQNTGRSLKSEQDICGRHTIPFACRNKSCLQSKLLVVGDTILNQQDYKSVPIQNSLLFLSWWSFFLEELINKHSCALYVPLILPHGIEFKATVSTCSPVTHLCASETSWWFTSAPEHHTGRHPQVDSWLPKDSGSTPVIKLLAIVRTETGQKTEGRKFWLHLNSKILLISSLGTFLSQ